MAKTKPSASLQCERQPGGVRCANPAAWEVVGFHYSVLECEEHHVPWGTPYPFVADRRITPGITERLSKEEIDNYAHDFLSPAPVLAVAYEWARLSMATYKGAELAAKVNELCKEGWEVFSTYPLSHESMETVWLRRPL